MDGFLIFRRRLGSDEVRVLMLHKDIYDNTTLAWESRKALRRSPNSARTYKTMRTARTVADRMNKKDDGYDYWIVPKEEAAKV